MLRAYKYRIYPTDEQKDFFSKSFGCARYVYNWGISINKELEKLYRENKEKYPDDKNKWGNFRYSYYDVTKKLTSLKKEEDKSFLNDIYSTTLINALNNLYCAYKRIDENNKSKKNGFKHHPSFKSKNNGNQSFQITNIKVDFKTNKVIVPKLKTKVKCIFHRRFIGKIKTTTISKNCCNEYYISILVDNGLPLPSLTEENNYDNNLGIDFGVANLFNCSDGYKSEKFHPLYKSIKKLKHLQRLVSKKFNKDAEVQSNNYNKAKLKLAKLHRKISNQREWFINNEIAKVCNKGYKNISVEDLNVKGMTKNHKLAKSILDASMGCARIKLANKCEELGIRFIKINRFIPSSQECSSCNESEDKNRYYRYKNLKLRTREWTCPICGKHHDRDLNAAKNIRYYGIHNPNNINLPKCTREVKSVESQTNSIKRSNSNRIEGSVKQKNNCKNDLQIHSNQLVTDNELYEHTD